MESRSDISSLSSKRSVDNHIPSIHVDQYLFDQHAKKISSLHESESGKSFPRIFTVAQTLKDPLILNHIKPDYGSLGEFIGDLNIGRDLLNQKKRKNEGNEDEAEEKKIKNIFKEKTQQQLNNAFLNKSSPSVYKKVAGKLLVQNLFKESFGVSLNAFQNQNVKQEPLKGFKFSLSYFDQIFEGRKQLPKKIQQQVQVNQQYSGDSTERKQQEKLSTRSIKILPQRQRLQLINQIKSKYNSLKKLQIKKDCQQYKKLLPKQASQDNWTESNLHHSHYDQEQERKKNEKSIQHIMQITETSINFQKFTIKPELMLFFMSQFGLQKIQSICLNQIRINQQTLCFMLELVKEVCQNLEKLTIKCLSIEKLQNFAIKIKEILQTTSLKELVLEYLDMDTKQFCMICLGVGSNTSLQLLNFDNNAVDERGCKSLELISKHCQNLKKISLKKNYLKPHHLSYFPAEAKSKIML